MEWFRMYHDVIHDPKIQRLAADLRWRWVELLCIASKADQRGRLPGVEDCAYLLRVTVPKATQIIETMIRNGLIDESEGDKTLTIHGWEARQKSSDSSKKRVEDWRKRQKKGRDGEDGNTPVTLTNCHPHARAQDSDTERETEENTPSPRYDPETDDLEPFHSPPVVASQAMPGTRSGPDLKSWNSAVASLKGKDTTAPLAGAMEMHADDPDIRDLEGWRFVQAARVVAQPGKPKNWKFLVGCARQASREEFEAWNTKSHGSPKAQSPPEPRRLPEPGPESPFWKLSARFNTCLDKHAL